MTLSLAPSTPTRSALVIGSDTRAFLGIVRSLGRHGVAVDAVPFDFTSVALKSQYIRQVHRLPPLALDPEHWVEALLRVCRQSQPDFIVPCDDRSILPLQAFRERTLPLRVGLPGDAAFKAFFDKAATRELAVACGVPVAPGRVLAAGESAPALAAEFGWPLFIKPRHSYRLQALDRRRAVRPCHDLAGLQAALAQATPCSDFLVEGESRGVGVGVSVLARQGVVSQIFQHRRIHEPEGGGGSTYRVSETLSPQLQAMVQSLCGASQLDGVAMFEFKVDDATGGSALLEVNARPWGSLPLALAAGVDFPWLWFQQALGESPAARQPYRVPCRARNLMADVYATQGRIEARQHAGSLARVGIGLGWAASFTRLLRSDEHVDEFAADDRTPGWLELRGLGLKVTERLTRNLPGRRALATRRARAVLRQAWLDAWRGRRELHIVVACYGNICRSPYAAARLGNALQGMAVVVSVVGASLAALPPRPSPARAVAAAARVGVDLAAHRSLYANDALLEAADLVLVFDGANQALLDSRGLSLRHPALRLREILHSDASAGSAVLAGGDADIADPVDGDDATFDRTYRLIDSAVAELRRVIQDIGEARA